MTSSSSHWHQGHYCTARQLTLVCGGVSPVVIDIAPEAGRREGGREGRRERGRERGREGRGLELVTTLLQLRGRTCYTSDTQLHSTGKTRLEIVVAVIPLNSCCIWNNLEVAKDCQQTIRQQSISQWLQTTFLNEVVCGRSECHCR